MGYRSLRTFVKIAVASLYISSASSAWAVDHVATRGGWDIFKLDDSCMMTMEYEGPGSTSLTLAKMVDGELYVSVSNSEWSAKKAAKYDITYRLNGVAFGGNASIGTETNYRPGFLTKFAADFEKAFAAGSTLHIYLEETRIDQLSLAGTAIALSSVNSCVANLREERAAAEKEKRRWEHIPKDPFQNAPEEPSGPTPRGSGLSWANANDYPSQALREGREGRVGFRLTVSAEGSVTNCEITESSGHADLDAVTCTNITRRARFTPAIGEDGKPKEGTWDSAINWAIPK